VCQSSLKLSEMYKDLSRLECGRRWWSVLEVNVWRGGSDFGQSENINDIRDKIPLPIASSRPLAGPTPTFMSGIERLKLRMQGAIPPLSSYVVRA
jgi:hypothetical protein